MVRGGYDDGVDIGPRQDFAVVQRRELGLGRFLRQLLALFVDIANGGDLDVPAPVGHVEHQLHQAGAAPADADQRDVDAVV